MELTDLKNKSLESLSELLEEKRAKFRELRFQANEAQLKNVRELRSVRKDIAQILTFINRAKAK